MAVVSEPFVSKISASESSRLNTSWQPRQTFPVAYFEASPMNQDGGIQLVGVLHYIKCLLDTLHRRVLDEVLYENMGLPCAACTNNVALPDTPRSTIMP